ncbi:Fe-S cluster assembly protein SufD [Acetobacter oryzoeni]|uniref:Fe-S cluster assembly protein SufD n=2 Tax=Acetobacter oryzoeni TaxID=2500548 RepID=A0A5B9GHJ1_9PROT|nr:Fe-S cluster assembly protein SufD [Acetobacter oryzoeni]MCP1203408.1 Fe-S cluster assembly protein SufD [Acetobacter oryzoeni]QEE85622.1 Fe-S cluster assembly protein SufD [Acetobacter oryzoeni]
MNAISKDMSGPLSSFAQRLNDVEGAERQAAIGALLRTGLPDRHVEAWKYTSLRPLSAQEFQAPPAQYDAAQAKSLLDNLLSQHDAVQSLPRIVFVNGRFVKDLSLLPEGVDVSFFSQKSLTSDVQASPDRDPLVALNTALVDDGAILHVAKGADAGRVLLISLGVAGDTAISFHPRHSVVLEEGAHLSLLSLSAGVGAYFHNPVTEVTVGESAKLYHTTLQAEGPQAIALATTYVQVAGHGVYNSFALGLGSLLSRHEVHARLNAPHAQLHVNGAQNLAEHQVGDITSVITHAASDCISRQTVRNVLDGHARGVFQGKVLVEQVAQKTDGYQMNQALLLSENAEIDAKPELEIYADDVRCSHGATVGALDDDQLFYMRSRGVPEAQARHILIAAFLDEALSLIEDETAQEYCRAMLAIRFSAERKAA